MNTKELKRFRKALEEHSTPPRPQETEREPLPERPAPDVLDPRAKSSGHGKKTADKWNQ